MTRVFESGGRGGGCIWDTGASCGLSWLERRTFGGLVCLLQQDAGSPKPVQTV